MDVDTNMDATGVTAKGTARDKTAPFLIRAFVKIGGFHRLNVFEDGTVPVADEVQLFAWKDATLRELLTTLRDTASPPSGAKFLHAAELKHPLARFGFKAVYGDSSPANGGKGRNTFKFAQKDLGMVYSRDILGEPGSYTATAGLTTAPRLMEDEETYGQGQAASVEGSVPKEKEDRTLDELLFVPGDYLLVSVILPKGAAAAAAAGTTPAAAGGAAELSIKGANSTVPVASVGWKRDTTRGEAAKERDAPSAPGRGVNAAHWRGGSDAPTFTSGRGRGGRGRGGRGGDRDTFGRDRDNGRDFAGRDRDNFGRDRDIGRDAFGRDRDFGGREERDRRPPPPRRPRDGSRSPSRSRSPPPRRGVRDASRPRSPRRSRSPVGRRGKSRSPRRSRTPPRRRGRYD